MPKKVKITTFFSILSFTLFFPFKNCVVFFPRRNLTITHSLIFRGKKNSSPGIKKTTSLTQSLDDSKSLQKLNFSANKKKTVPLPKGIVFFFSRKSWWVNQSIKSQNFVFLSGEKINTKYKAVFFFSQKKFMRHSFRIWWVFLYIL